MAEDFNEQLKAFSDKHGAVLLGMHHELKEMQASVDESAQMLKDMQDMSVELKNNIKDQRSQAIFAQKRITDDVLEQNKKLDKQLQIQKTELSQYIKLLDGKQDKIQQMQDRCLSLLREHKEREIIVHKWLKRAEICVLSCVVLISAFVWYLLWTR